MNVEKLVANIFLIAVLTGASSVASAEMIQAEVAAVDLSAHALKVVKAETGGHAAEPSSIQILVQKATRFDGLQSLDDLRIGDEVRVNLSGKKRAEVRKAKSIQLYKAHIRTAEEIKADEKKTVSGK